jgi:hypothetical protein
MSFLPADRAFLPDQRCTIRYGAYGNLASLNLTRFADCHINDRTAFTILPVTYTTSRRTKLKRGYTMAVDYAAARPVDAPSPELGTGSALSRSIQLIAIASFCTALAQPKVLGELKITFLLHDQFHAGPVAIALFLFLAQFSTYIKPVLGLIIDSLPLGQSRWRGYLLWSSLIAAAAWINLPVFAHAYVPFLLAALSIYLFIMVASTVLGGLMVETGALNGIAGRVASVREIAQSAVLVGSGLLSGWLASRPIAWMACIGFAVMAVLAVAAFLLLQRKDS